MYSALVSTSVSTLPSAGPRNCSTGSSGLARCNALLSGASAPLARGIAASTPFCRPFMLTSNTKPIPIPSRVFFMVLTQGESVSSVVRGVAYQPAF